MKSEIQRLQSEIQQHSDEIEELQTELEQLTRSNSESPDSPAGVAEAVRAVAAAQPVIVGLRDAIATLQVNVEKKQKALISLERVVLENTKRERLEIGKEKLRIQAEQLKELGDSIEASLLEIKALSEEFSCDYRALHCSQQSGIYHDYSGLVGFGVACCVPVLVEDGRRFSLATRTIDLFSTDRQAQQTALHADRAQIEGRLRQSMIRTQAELEERQQEAVRGKAENKQQDLSQLLLQKRADLRVAQDLRAGEAAEVDRGVKLDLSRIDNHISDLTSEIRQLESQFEGVGFGSNPHDRI